METYNVVAVAVGLDPDAETYIAYANCVPIHEAMHAAMVAMRDMADETKPYTIVSVRTLRVTTPESAPESAPVCTCCALWIANADDSGCRDYYGHTHKRCAVTGGLSDNDKEVWETWICAGCETVMLPGSNQWTLYP